MDEAAKTPGFCNMTATAVADLVNEAMDNLSLTVVNREGPEAIFAAVHALNDMNKAGTLTIRPPHSFTVVQHQGADARHPWRYTANDPAFQMAQKAAEMDGNPYPADQITAADVVREQVAMMGPLTKSANPPASRTTRVKIDHRTIVDRNLVPPNATPDDVMRMAFGCRVEVTADMVAIGDRHVIAEVGDIQKMGPGFSPARFAVAIYRAMHAAAPVEMMSVAEGMLRRDLTQAHADIETYAKALQRAAADIDARDIQIAGFASVAPTWHEIGQLESMRREAACRVIDLEDRVAALERERNELGVRWQAARDALIGENAAYRERDEALAARQVAQAEARIALMDKDEYLTANIALRTELMAARDTIARLMAANVPDPSTPDPIANAIRPRVSNWRIGG